MSDVVSSSLSTLADDAVKIVDNLIPPGSHLERIVGALILHVEKLAGGKLEHLTDEALGITPTPEATQETPAVDSASQGPAAVALAEAEKENQKLRDELAAAQKPGVSS